MYVGGVMACTREHAPLSKRISPMFPPAVHKCTLGLPILSEGRSLQTRCQLSDADVVLLQAANSCRRSDWPLACGVASFICCRNIDVLVGQVRRCEENATSVSIPTGSRAWSVSYCTPSSFKPRSICAFQCERNTPTLSSSGNSTSAFRYAFSAPVLSPVPANVLPSSA